MYMFKIMLLPLGLSRAAVCFWLITKLPLPSLVFYSLFFGFVGPGVGGKICRWIVSRHVGLMVRMDDTWRDLIRGIGARGVVGL